MHSQSRHRLNQFVRRTVRFFNHRPWSIAGAVGGCLLIVFLNSCSSFIPAAVPPPEIPGAHFVGNKACADCHAEIVRKFPSSPHSRLYAEQAAMPGQSGCESCHGPGSRHIEAANHQWIVNPGKQVEACFKCHLDSQAEFNLPQHHPVVEGRMNCVQCHDPHGTDILKPSRGLAMARVNESCADCHREQVQPFVFEHEAMREGCVTCHNPHGSINRKMLVQPDSNLCLRCHNQVQGSGVAPGEFFIGKVPHAGLMQAGTCWSAGCHTAVHGSNIQPRMLF